MPNSNYTRGATLERVIRDDAEADGCMAVRAAGSKGPADVVVFERVAPAIRIKARAWAVSVKINRWPSPAERDAMVAWYDVGVVPVIVCRSAGVKWWRLVTADGAMVELPRAPWL